MIIEEQKTFFHELDTYDVLGTIVILDIDGTLACSSETSIASEVSSVVKKLQENNDVYVFSNNYNGKRSRQIARSINLKYINSNYKKPNKKVMMEIEDMLPVVVIGDKYLTDGLFAQFIGARYLRVKRYKCNGDSVANKLACTFDDIIYFFARRFYTLK